MPSNLPQTFPVPDNKSRGVIVLSNIRHTTGSSDITCGGVSKFTISVDFDYRLL